MVGQAANQELSCHRTSFVHLHLRVNCAFNGSMEEIQPSCRIKSVEICDIARDFKGNAFKTKHPENSAVTIHNDRIICAIGGWDGK